MLLLHLLLAADSKDDPANVRARLLSQATLSFSRHVFAGDSFPAGTLSRDPALKDLLDADTPVSVRFYSAMLEPVKKPEKAGPYAAVIRIEPKGVPPLVRFATLYKLPDSDLKKALAALDAKVVERNPEARAELTKRLAKPDWHKDERVARLLAGLHLSRPGEGPARKWEDAQAVERQWWVDLKCLRLYPEVRKRGERFKGPLPMKGVPHPVLREGTEEEAGFKKGSRARIDAALEAFSKDTDHPFAVCLARNGVIVLHKAYGKTTTDTPLWMASVTKTMSATLMMQLIGQGIVAADDPIGKHYPALDTIKAKKPLTLRHLYTHTNGLTLDGFPPWNDEMHDVCERIAAYRHRLRVGEEWSYTGTGNMVGSKALELLTGKAVPQAYRAFLLEPLGCTDTHVSDTHAGCRSTPLDMARFAQMLLQKGAYGGHRFFPEELFDKLMLPGPLTDLAPVKRQFGFGLDGSRTRFGHGTASGAVFHIDAERKLVWIMTRDKYGKNQDKHNGLVWKAIDEGIAKSKTD
ncbi:MAG: beta-lactamase family protein [Gemmataceae bacterium]|nr:beta-lactamase family protein [Gemmataceae bacterium]